MTETEARLELMRRDLAVAIKRAELAEKRIALCLALIVEFPVTFGTVAPRIRAMLTADI